MPVDDNYMYCIEFIDVTINICRKYERFYGKTGKAAETAITNCTA
jgi:hypothetical protein